MNDATGAGTATADNDYVAMPTIQIAFTAGNIYAYAQVLINGDLLKEPDETFEVNLSGAIVGNIVDNRAEGLILNDDSASALSISDVGITKDNSSTKDLTFSVTLSKASGQTVTVNYATAVGVARSTSDYTAKSSMLTFAPGTELTQTVRVEMSGDTAVEGNETFYMLLSGAVNACGFLASQTKS